MTVITEMKSGDKRARPMDGKKWLQYSISVWNDIRKSPEELRISHPAMFPVALCKRLIELFSRESDLILDPFTGSGSTLIAASDLGRNAIGVELSSQFVKLYESRLNQSELFDDTRDISCKMITGDARHLLQYVKPRSVTLTITSPPYWDILNQRRTADGKVTRHYGNESGDLGAKRSYASFIKELANVFESIHIVTKEGGYCCVIVMDIRKGKKFYPFHVDVINSMADIGFELDDIIIWDRRQEYNNLRPLGYPHVFRVNKIHEFILIFKKH
ncbi:MAG TPA: site-specific DNA-methyltransferase [Candidatus Deferrimicrobium sp.]|nr:site-specific DNA-methyltransferase [Candidatus Deferrimicrobium sp.]